MEITAEKELQMKEIKRILNKKLEGSYMCEPRPFCKMFDDSSEVGDYMDMFLPIELFPEREDEFYQLADELFDSFDGEYFQ